MKNNNEYNIGDKKKFGEHEYTLANKFTNKKDAQLAIEKLRYKSPFIGESIFARLEIRVKGGAHVEYRVWIRKGGGKTRNRNMSQYMINIKRKSGR